MTVEEIVPLLVEMGAKARPNQSKFGRQYLDWLGSVLCVRRTEGLVGEIVIYYSLPASSLDKDIFVINKKEDLDDFIVSILTHNMEPNKQ